jgi:serine/threonine protein kinase
MKLSPGSRLGPYEVQSLLDEGGLGEVYLALDAQLGREVAIRVLPPDVVRDEERRHRFIHEARAASALNHPNVGAIYQMESIGDVDFVVMEHVAGQSVESAIRSGLSLTAALRIAIPLAEALATAHAAGTVHRGLEPASVMVKPNGVVKVLDFGLATLLGTDAPGGTEADGTTASTPATAENPGQPGTIARTPAYMSPEQAKGGTVDARSDVFSFGALLYEMVTGQRAFDRGTREATLYAVVAQAVTLPSDIVPALPADLEQLILKCLRKHPDRRYQDMSDVKADLQLIKDDLEFPVTDNTVRRPRGWWWFAAGLIVAALAAGVV